MLTSSLRNSCENCTHTLHRSMLGSRTGFPKLIGCSSWRTMAGPANTLPTTITSRNNACSNFMQDKSFYSSISPVFLDYRIPSFLKGQRDSEKPAEVYNEISGSCSTCTEKGEASVTWSHHFLTCVTCEFILQHANITAFMNFAAGNHRASSAADSSQCGQFLTTYTDTWCKFTQSPSNLCSGILWVNHLPLVCMHKTRCKNEHFISF